MTKHGVTSGPSTRAEPLLARGASVGGVIAGKYRIERVIGHGGMGVVVAASHLALQRTVAIKLIRGDWADDPLAVERLVREARALASIQSQHVARVLDVGTLDDGIPFIVMEYLEGQDLDSLLRSEGPLPVADAIDYLVQACEALAEAHRNGIVHRDIKPANLFVARQPGGGACIKVVDFGISKLINSASVESLTHPSRIVGSLYHMAPEQMSGDPVDARTDVWALGVLLFELLTGRKPFQGGAWPAVCARVLSDSAPPLESLGERVPGEVQSAVRRCLQRMPEDRFSNVAELAVALSPFGTRIARLATSTGSLAAESSSPPGSGLGSTPPGGFERAPSAVSATDASLLRNLARSERRDLGLSEGGDAPARRSNDAAALRGSEATPPPRWNTPAPARVDAVLRDIERRDLERRDLERRDFDPRGFDPRELQLEEQPSGEALRLERRRSSARHLASPVAGVRRRNVQWLVVGAAALVVVGVPWLVTRLLRPAAAELQAVQGAVTDAQRAPSTHPSIVEVTPALLPGRAALPHGVAAPAPGGGAASSGPILAPERELLAPSPPSTNLPVAQLAAAQLAAPQLPPKQLPATPSAPAPQVRVLLLPEEGAPHVTPVAERAAVREGAAVVAAPVAKAEPSPSAAAAPAASAAVGHAPAGQVPAGQAPSGPTSPGQSAAPSAPRGANPWDFRDLEFE
jgi:eukaryotic-like serine/threonine-protein kinase